MLRRMARADDDAPLAAADRQFIVLAQTAEDVGHARDILAETAETRRIAVDAALAEAGRAVEIQRFLRRFAAGVEDQRLAHQEIGARHLEFDVPFAREPAGEADMIGMEMGDDEAGDGLALEARLKDLTPQGLDLVGRNAGVDHRPAFVAFDQPEIDVVELEGQRHPDP